MRQSKNEKIDALLEEAAKISIEELIEDYPNLNELEGQYEFSSKHSKKMNKLFKKAKKLEIEGEIDAWHKFRKFSFNAAAVICMLFTVFTLVAFTVPEIRVAITNYFVEKNEEHIVINTESNTNNNEMTDGTPKYIPEGFEIISIIKTDIMIDAVYQNNDNDFIYYTRNAGETMLTIDNENNDFNEINISEYPGYISEKHNEITVVFHDGEYTYHIVSNIDREEIIKIAVSLLN